MPVRSVAMRRHSHKSLGSRRYAASGVHLKYGGWHGNEMRQLFLSSVCVLLLLLPSFVLVAEGARGSKGCD